MTPDEPTNPPEEGPEQPSEPTPPETGAESTGPEQGGAATPPEGQTGAPAEGEPAGEQAPGPPEPEPGFIGTLKGINQAMHHVGRKRALAATVTLFGIGIGALLLVSGFSFWWTSQPSFCAKCHPMQKYVDAWEKSPHSDVTCEDCHLTPGLFGFMGGKIAGLQVVMNYVRGNYEDYSFNAAVSNASCLRCHEGILSAPIHGKDTGVLVSHKDIIESGGKCMSCHSTVGHGDAVPPGSATHPTMQACLTCHNDQIAPLDCDLCHVGKKATEGSAMPPASIPPSMPTPFPSIPPEATIVPSP